MNTDRLSRILLGALLALSLPVACSRTLPDDVWAVVDDHEIHRDEVEKAFRQVQQPNQTPTDDEAMALKLNVVDELITQQVLAAKAKALKLDVTEGEVDAAFADRKKNLGEDQFQQELRQRNLTQDDMRQAVRNELVANKVLEHEVFSKIVVSDQDVATFYNTNKAQFDVKEPAYHVAQIIVTPIKDAQTFNRLHDDATTPDEADKKARMIMDRLKSGANFQQLAADYSEDQTALQGGDLGFVAASDLNKTLRDEVQKLNPGSVTLFSGGGAHNIVALVEKAQPGLRDLNSPGVREGITNTIRTNKEQLLRTAYIITLRSDAKIVNALARQLVAAQAKLPPPAAPAAPGK